MLHCNCNALKATEKGKGRNGHSFCDFKDRSGTFNGRNIEIPGVGTIPAVPNIANVWKTTEILDLIKLPINYWRTTKNRILRVSTIRSWMKDNFEIKKNIPRCPTNTDTESQLGPWTNWSTCSGCCGPWTSTRSRKSSSRCSADSTERKSMVTYDCTFFKSSILP